MSHEIRTPMNAVLGLAQVGLRESEKRKSWETFTRILDSGQLLLGIVNDILDFSKIEAGRLSLEKRLFSPGDVIDQAVNLVASRAYAKGLAFRLEEPADLPELCSGDDLRIVQVLVNLLSNAIKFTRQGRVTLSAWREGQELCFRVADTGIGMNPAQLARLFKPFEQADYSTSRLFGGTGLGLAISKRLVDLMGGEIGVESLVGAGSTFWFTVRLDLASSDVDDRSSEAGDALAPDSPEARLKARWAGTRVLLAEDEPINQEVSRDFLEDAGLQVDLAEDGAAALALARTQPYALILMDMQMPRMNGMEATQAIRALPDYADIRIVAMTANAMQGDEKACLDAGMDGYVPKPVVKAEVIAEMLRVLQPDIDAADGYPHDSD